MQGTALKAHQSRVGGSGPWYKATSGNGRKCKNNDKTRAALHFIFMVSRQSETKPRIKTPPCSGSAPPTPPRPLESHWLETPGQTQHAPCLQGACGLGGEPTAQGTPSAGSSQQPGRLSQSNVVGAQLRRTRARIPLDKEEEISITTSRHETTWHGQGKTKSPCVRVYVGG